ncbi:hypothetical protein [Pacificibacter marinus]|uniref:hypothetical protein n=1 Tax=Pacificibacter marinus TaxID=658057 RepID=UPI00147D79D5|nr:hypothetical protein [Pacificibacter marinus]
MKDFDAQHPSWPHGEKFIDPKVTTKGDTRATVALSNPHCVKFYVLGGASCSA